MKFNNILPFEALVLSLLLLILIIVGAMGSYTFKRLNAIVVTISNQSKPDNRLGIMKDILNDLYRSEISVKSYRLTKDNNYLMEFYLSAKTINNRIEQLQEYAVVGDTMYFATDSMRALIEQEYEILEALLKVKDEYRVKVALDKAMETVDKNIITIEKIEAANEFNTYLTDSIQNEQQAEEKTNFFKRIFGSSKRKKKKEEADTAVIEAPIVVAELPDTANSNSKLNRINQNLAELSQKETAQERLMNIRELKLINKSELNMQQIRNLLIGMEVYQMKIIGQKSKKTEELAQEIKNLIGLFTFATAFLILLAAAITINYVRKNNQYKKVLRDARKKAEELAIEKERFLANMSHEIRTPMNAIVGYTEQLLHSELNNAQREQLEIVKKAGNHLIQIINEVLDFSTIQAGKAILKKEKFTPHEMITDVVQLMLPVASKKNLSLNYTYEDKQISVLGDDVRFRQILLNLLSNAIKYTEQGEVKIDTSVRIIDNRRIQFTIVISDTGVGMSADFLKKVFEEFERADITPDKSETGSGLGLAITKKLIDLHRGRISFQSTEGKGTKVKIMLPYQINNEQENQSHETENKPSDINSLKFLVVDDVEYNRKLIGTILKRNGAVYHEAINGREAVEKLKNEKYDIVLMDMRMPMMDGVTATKEIRKFDKKVQIFALTASISEKEKAEYKKAGILKTLIKPISENDLLSAISEPNESTNEAIIRGIENNDKFNLDELWKLCQKDKAFFNEMLDSFIKTSKETIELMKFAMKENDLKKISFLAHRLSGPTKHIGAEKLLEYLKVLEYRSNKLANSDLNKLLLNSEKELEEIIQFISESRHAY
ncbi:MAG TPA: response regulator [Bacteroidales bacterium]